MKYVLWLCAVLVVAERRAFEGAYAYRTKRDRKVNTSRIDATAAEEVDLRHANAESSTRFARSGDLVHAQHAANFSRKHDSASSLRSARNTVSSASGSFLPVVTFLIGLIAGSVMGAAAMKKHIELQKPPLVPLDPVRRADVRKKTQKRIEKRKTSVGFQMRGRMRTESGAFVVHQKTAKIPDAEPEAPDLLQFEEAIESSDVNRFVDLLASNEPIVPPDAKMHPWVENPKTVGTLAGTQIAIVASNCTKDDPSTKLKIQEAGAIPMLVNFMRLAESDDRVQTAVVALSFLTLDCTENTREAYDEGAMELLLQHLESPTPGMRAAAATTLRNICMDGEPRIVTFVEMGGLKGLVNQLFTSPDTTLNNADIQLESVLNLQDILEGPTGKMHPGYAQKAVSYGVVPRLQILQLSTGDQDLREAASELAANIEAVTTPLEARQS